ncbi:transporter [Haliea sp. E17]|uniref:transporter n=1 Tax=Haliea sp. E17 TaxID=3401576 RepID=UPI003AACACB5
MLPRLKLRLLLVLLIPLVPGRYCVAQELTPRAYWPAPQGTEVLTLGLSYTDGDTVPDPSLPVSGIDSQITTAFASYLRTFSLWGRTASVVLQQPYSTGTTTANHEVLGKLERDYQGVGDFSATLGVNLLGAPAMSREEFAELRRNPHPILGASVRVLAPTGRYQEDRLINVGANRWAVKAELGYMTALRPQWLLEFELGAWIFGDNDDFVGMKREQDPIYALQTHLIRRFSAGFWVSLDANIYRGGRGKLDGRKLDDLQRDSRFGINLAVPFAGRNVVKLSYAMGSVNDSDENFDIYQLTYQRLL